MAPLSLIVSGRTDIFPPMSTVLRSTFLGHLCFQRRWPKNVLRPVVNGCGVSVSDFHATTSTLGKLWDIYWSWRFWIKRSKLHDALRLGENERLRIAWSWFQKLNSFRWTWYSNECEDRDRPSGRGRLVQNSSFFLSTEFAGTDHKILVAALKIRIRSQRFALFKQVCLDVHCLRDGNVDQEYKSKFAESFTELNDTDGPQ